MFGISFEHVLVLGIILLFVGPKRLPQLGHTLGKAIKNFKDGVSGVEDAAYRKLDETRQAVQAPVGAPASTTNPEENVAKSASV